MSKGKDLAYNLIGKKALVTGGARRIGEAICLNLAEAGADIVVHCFNSLSTADELAKQIREQGRSSWSISADLNDRYLTADLIKRAVDMAGPLDILINNASIFYPDQLDSFTGESLDLNIQVNAFAPIVLSREFAAQGREGVIVNCLDTRITAYDSAHAAYHLSKRMLFAATKMAAYEYAPGIRVNAVAPGLILPPPGEDEAYLREKSSTLPLKRHGKAGDVAEAVRFLLMSDFVTGQIIYVDGGCHLKTSFYG